MNTHRILITGSRRWSEETNGFAIRDVLAGLYAVDPSAVLVHGGADGADVIASALWTAMGGSVEVHLADWKVHGRAAGPIRNQYMVDLGADVCLAFIWNNSRGATDCATRAEKAGIPTIFHREGP